MVKGYLYTIEVLITISLIGVLLIFTFKTAPPLPSYETAIIRQQGASALTVLMKKDLRILMNQKNETTIVSKLSQILPPNIQFEAIICKDRCISTLTPENKEIISYTVYSSGYLNYNPKQLKLYMWRKS